MTSSDLFSTPTVGTSIQGPSGEEIGTLSDVVFDTSTGRLRFAVMELAGDATQLVVPWESLSFRPGEPPVVKLSPEDLRKAPRFEVRDARAAVEAASPREPYSRVDDWHGIKGLPPSADVTAQHETPHLLGVRGLIGAVALGSIVAVGYLASHTFSDDQTGRVQRMVGAVTETTTAVKESSTDAATTVKVKTALALSKRVPALHVSVKTQHAVATLTGAVPTPEARDLAGQIAEGTSGVREVRNLLVVDSGNMP